jgi:hypothetical protein
MPFLSEIYTFGLWLNAISARDFYLWFVAQEFFISALIFTKNPVLYYFEHEKVRLEPVTSITCGSAS